MKKRTKIIAAVLILILAMPIIISVYVRTSTDDYIISGEKSAEIKADCILILGAGLRADGTPDHMLKDRLDVGIALYNEGAAPKLLLSGDNGQEEYDEVNSMKAYVLNKGVPLKDIFLDHAGFSTYESMYRARDIFEVKKAIVITQRYHQYRSLFIARGLGLDAYGVASDPRTYSGQTYREVREIMAQNKDFLKMLTKPAPKYLGDVIPISGSGFASQD